MKNIGKLRKLILLPAIAALLLGSCAKDRTGNVAPGSGETDVEMTFKAPRNYTRAAIAAEDELKDITLLVFEGSGATSKFLYSRYAWRTSASGNQFKTTLRMGEDLAIYFAANAKDLIKGLEDSGKLVEGETTWAAAKELLILDAPTGFDLTGKGLPMWGHKFEVDIADQPNNSLGKVDLLRAVASTDITMAATNFTLEKGHLVFAANKGYLAYDPTLLDEDDGQATQPQSPSGMTTTVEWSKTVEDGDDGKINNYFYMYENATPLTPTGTNRPTKVILEGVWTGTGGSGETTFYPLTFRDYNKTTEEYDKKQVTRNNKYLIVVTGVHGDGWKDIDDAKDADDVNMEYDVIDWNTNEDGQIDIDGPKYFYRASTSILLSYRKDCTGEILFRTNYAIGDIEMTFTAGGTTATGTVYNDRFKAEALEADPDGQADSGDEYTCFRFTTLKAYADDSDNPSTLYVTAGRISFSITVTQLDRDPAKWEDGGQDEKDL